MSDNTGIEWADASWSPIIGCTRVSAGCDNCYAITTARIRSANPNPKVAVPFAGTVERTADRVDWTGRVNLLPDRLDQPLRWTKPRRIFVNSMSDLFHDDVPDGFIAAVFGVMSAARAHTFQVLTKRHARMRSLLSSEKFRELVTINAVGQVGHAIDSWPLPNVWLGVSVENQKWADVRIPVLLDTPAAVRFLSCEPLLGPVDLRPAWTTPQEPVVGFAPALNGSGAPWPHAVDWVIVGGESGRGARPMHPDWARSLRDQCVAAGVPFLFKQWGEFVPTGGQVGSHRMLLDGTSYPSDGGCVMSGEEIVSRVGKKAAGRELDGRTWDEFPTPAVVTR